MLGSRKEKQPIQMPSAGSTFKRGNNFITAKLIDVLDLIEYVKNTVYNKTNNLIELEVQIIGEK